MEFLKAVEEAKVKAAETGQAHFVYREIHRELFFVEAEFHKHWLFRAYPGGRTVLSVIGLNVCNSLGVVVPSQEK